MGGNRLSKSVAAFALVVIGVQALSHPSTNLLSVRASRSEMLDGLWPRSSSLLQYPSWSTGQVEPDTSFADVAERCGATTDLAPIAERVGESRLALREMAQSMYRTDIIESVAGAAPWWRIKIWQLGSGLGLRTGRLDQPSEYLSEHRIRHARASADRWYQRVTRHIICDAVRSDDAKVGTVNG